MYIYTYIYVIYVYVYVYEYVYVYIYIYICVFLIFFIVSYSLHEGAAYSLHGRAAGITLSSTVNKHANWTLLSSDDWRLLCQFYHL